MKHLLLLFTLVFVSSAAVFGNNGCEKCGVDNKSNGQRVFGGTQTEKNRYPWMVVVKTFSRKSNMYGLCGGTLVASKYVISAAHCMYLHDTKPVPSSQVKIIIGEHDISTPEWGGIGEMTIDVAKYTNHESFSYPYNDITIIELAWEVDLSIYTPACLAKSSDTTAFDGKTALLTGWGETESGHTSHVLMEVAQMVQTRETCYEFQEEYGEVGHAGHLCAGGVEGEGACYGDSGGPLTYKSGDQHVLIGEVIGLMRDRGLRCALHGGYVNYGRISYYRDWIESNMFYPSFCANGPDADEYEPDTIYTYDYFKIYQ